MAFSRCTKPWLSLQARFQQSYADSSAEELLGVLHRLDAERLHAALQQAMTVQSGELVLLLQSRIRRKFNLLRMAGHGQLTCRDTKELAEAAGCCVINARAILGYCCKHIAAML